MYGRAMRSALMVMFVAACGSSSAPTEKPVANAAAEQCGGMVWPTKLAKPSTPESHREAAVRLLEASGVRTAYAQMMEISLGSMIKANPTIAPYEGAMREFFAKYASYDAIAGEFAELYVRTFDELQLRQIEAFYRTPTGQASVTEMPKVMQEGAKIGERNVVAHQKELIDLMMKAQAQGGTTPSPLGAPPPAPAPVPPGPPPAKKKQP